MFVNQKPNETVKQYYSNLLIRSSRLQKSQSEILTMFVRGLLNPLKMYVLSRQPETLEKSFQLAKNAESLQVISDTTGDTGQSIHMVNMPGEIRGGAIGDKPFESEMELELKSLRENCKRKWIK